MGLRRNWSRGAFACRSHNPADLAPAVCKADLRANLLALGRNVKQGTGATVGGVFLYLDICSSLAVQLSPRGGDHCAAGMAMVAA